MKNVHQKLFVLVVACLIILHSATIVSAQSGEDDKEIIGSASSGVVYSDPLPALTLGTEPSLNSVNPVPGGGYATAEARLDWALARMDGSGITGLSSGVSGFFSLCSEVASVVKDGVNKGGAPQQCGSYTGGGSKKVTKSVYEYVIGSTWQANTNHGVSASGYSWWPSLSVTATPTL